MTDLTPEKLDELAKLEKEATPGPWNDRGENGVTQTKHLTRDVWTIPRTVEDMSLIVALRNNASELIQAARERDELESRLEESLKFHNPACACTECDDE